MSENKRTETITETDIVLLTVPLHSKLKMEAKTASTILNDILSSACPRKADASILVVIVGTRFDQMPSNIGEGERTKEHVFYDDVYTTLFKTVENHELSDKFTVAPAFITSSKDSSCQQISGNPDQLEINDISSFSAMLTSLKATHRKLCNRTLRMSNEEAERFIDAFNLLYRLVSNLPAFLRHWKSELTINDIFRLAVYAEKHPGSASKKATDCLLEQKIEEDSASSRFLVEFLEEYTRDAGVTGGFWGRHPETFNQASIREYAEKYPNSATAEAYARINP